jgi:pimeloyl-ACP methyl ester carboxylesterase
VIPRLQAEGYQVIAAQYGLDTLAGDAATVRRTLGRVSSPAILVGHSYGGSVITAAGTDDRVAGLVECFAGDLSEQEQKVVWATHFAPAAELFTQKLDGVAWRLKLSSYIVATNDRTVQPELQRFVAKRMGATTHEVASSHAPMLSNPNLVIDVIRTAAKAVQKATVSSVKRVEDYVLATVLYCYMQGNPNSGHGCLAAANSP